MSLDSDYNETNNEYEISEANSNQKVCNKFYDLIRSPFVKIREEYDRFSDEFYHLTGW